MKNVLIIFFATLAIFSCAQKNRIKGNGELQTVSRTISKFDVVRIASSVDVEITEGDFDGKVKIIAESNIAPYIKTTVENNKLIVSIQKGISISTTKGMKIQLKSNKVRGVEIEGSGDFKKTGKNNVDEFSVAISGSGDVESSVTSNKVSVAISGSGDVKLHGNAQSLTVAVSGSGDVDAKDLKTSKTSITVNGSGDTKTWAVDNLSVVIGGSGDVYYKGNPSISKVDNGSGDLIQIN